MTDITEQLTWPRPWIVDWLRAQAMGPQRIELADGDFRSDLLAAATLLAGLTPPPRRDVMGLLESIRTTDMGEALRILNNELGAAAARGIMSERTAMQESAKTFLQEVVEPLRESNAQDRKALDGITEVCEKYGFRPDEDIWEGDWIELLAKRALELAAADETLKTKLTQTKSELEAAKEDATYWHNRFVELNNAVGY